MRLETELKRLGARSAHGSGVCCPCMSGSDLLKVLLAIAAALAHLHESEIVHYDIKSENVMLGNGGLWKLCDFGSASHLTFEQENAQRRELLEAEEFVTGRCTPMYRAPEVADVYLRWPIGPAVDVFAAGCVLFAMATGAHPFPADSLLANVQARFQMPAAMQTAYAPAVSTWLRRLLAREPHRRPTSADLHAELSDFLSSRLEPPGPDAIRSLKPHELVFSGDGNRRR